MHYLLKWIKFSVKKTKHIKKILEKSGNFVSPEKWEPCKTRIYYDNDGKLISTHKRSLGQGNVFRPVCHSVHGQGDLPPKGLHVGESASGERSAYRGVCPLTHPRTRKAAGSILLEYFLVVEYHFFDIHWNDYSDDDNYDFLPAAMKLWPR